MGGYYGGFGVVDLEMVYITTTVSGISIRNKYYVVTWVEIDNPEGASGSVEAFTCKMEYVRSPSEFNLGTLNIETYDGIDIDFSRV